MKAGDLARIKGNVASGWCTPHDIDLVVLVQTVDQVKLGDEPTIDLGDLWRVYSPESRGVRMMHEIYLEVVASA